MATHSPLVFVENKEAPVNLIEVTSDGHARRLEVMEDLVAAYVEKDFSTDGCKTKQPKNVETIKLFWSRRVGEYNGSMTPVPLSSHIQAHRPICANTRRLLSRSGLQSGNLCLC